MQRDEIRKKQGSSVIKRISPVYFVIAGLAILSIYANTLPLVNAGYALGKLLGFALIISAITSVTLGYVIFRKARFRNIYAYNFFAICIVLVVAFSFLEVKAREKAGEVGRSLKNSALDYIEGRVIDSAVKSDGSSEQEAKRVLTEFLAFNQRISENLNAGLVEITPVINPANSLNDQLRKTSLEKIKLLKGQLKSASEQKIESIKTLETKLSTIPDSSFKHGLLDGIKNSKTQSLTDIAASQAMLTDLVEDIEKLIIFIDKNRAAASFNGKTLVFANNSLSPKYIGLLDKINTDAGKITAFEQKKIDSAKQKFDQLQ
jgi:hypothetical protein